MKFNFDLANAAVNNSEEAHIREATRMGCIAWGLVHMGHDVIINGISKSFENSPRWTHFKALYGTPSGGVYVCPAEADALCDVGIKCSVDCTKDKELYSRCSCLVAHEYDMKHDSHNRLIPVPFLVHDRVMEYLMSAGLFQAYVSDDLEKLRKHFSAGKQAGRVGFQGCGWSNRKHWAKELPDYCECVFYYSHSMSAADHCRWLMGFEAGIVFPGDTPKVNLMPLLAMLGISIVSIECPVRVIPPITDRNSILLKDWNDHEGLEFGLQRLKSISEAATEDYKSGWSPMGQARLIAEAVS